MVAVTYQYHLPLRSIHWLAQQSLSCLAQEEKGEIVVQGLVLVVVNEEIERIPMHVRSWVWCITVMDDGVLCHKRRRVKAGQNDPNE